MAYHKLSILNVILVIGILTRELCHGTGVQEMRDPDDPIAGGNDAKAGEQSHCYKCDPTADADCFDKDPLITEKCTSGCMTFRLETSEGIIGKAGKMCISGNEHLINCARVHARIPLENGRCYKTKVPTDSKLVLKISDRHACPDDENDINNPDHLQYREDGRPKPKADLLVCTCQGNLCNSAKNTKNAVEVPRSQKSTSTGSIVSRMGGVWGTILTWNCLFKLVNL